MKYTALLLWLGVFAGSATGHAFRVSAAALELPAEWSVTPLTAPTQTMGLRVSSYIINEPAQDVRRWRQQHMGDCRLPAASDDDDWHCVDEYHIYSMLLREEGYIWVFSERVEQRLPEAGLDALPTELTYLDAQVISHSETPFESITILHSRRSLYGLQRDLLHLHRTQGARLVLQEQDAGGFVQQWQDEQDRVIYTAQKNGPGEVLLVQVRGTNL